MSDGQDRYHRRVTAALESERARREARRRLDAEERGRADAPEITTLRDRLARPRRLTRWRIERWQPEDTRVILAAQFKAGKTTTVGNLLRCLADGDPWLGRDPVSPVHGAVALLDFEMSATQLDDWLRAQRIQNDQRVLVMSLRGHATAFNICDSSIRSQWAAQFRHHRVAYCILDCLRPVLDALGLDEHRDAGRFLVAFDTLLAEAHISEAILVHHMGHTGERSRGDSRLRDWPDVEWRLIRQDDDPASPRFIQAYGRDVDVPESQLLYESHSRQLTIAGGSRQDTKTRSALEAVVGVLSNSTAPLTGRAIKKALADTDHARNTIDVALRYGLDNGSLVASDGPRRSKLYREVSRVAPVSRECTGDGACECPTAFVRRDTRTLTDDAGEPPPDRDTRPFAFDADPVGKAGAR